MLPVINAFKIAHQLTDVTVVADAGMVCEANQVALAAAGLSFILGTRIPHLPDVVRQWRDTHPDAAVPDGLVLTQPWPSSSADRIPLDGQVPHPTTLMKLTTRCGLAAVDGLNEALLAKAAEAKLLRTHRIRVDTTVAPANVAYPTDSGLLVTAIRRIAVTGKRIQAAGGAVRTRVRDRSRAAGKRAHEIAAKLRTRSAAGRDEAQATVRRVTGELAELAATAAEQAERLLRNAKQALRRARAEADKTARARCA